MAEVIQLRRALATDASAIRDLTRQAYAKWIPVLGREPKPMSADYDAAVLTHRFDLLYVDGVLAALIETVDQGDRLLIKNLAVSPAYQRRGLGTKLMAQAEEIAALLGYDRVWLYTTKLFVGNVELYSRLGYGVDGEESIGGGLIGTNMSKIIAPDRR